MTVRGALREATASIRFAGRIARRRPVPLGDVFVIEEERVLAFCAGLPAAGLRLDGALAQLDAGALAAMLAHERHHARRRDPLRLAAGRVLARALLFVPGLAQLLARQQAVAELSADESAVNIARGSRAALARAMLSFSRGMDPARVDHLLGKAPELRFPRTVCLVAGSAIVLVIATVLLAGRVAAGSATLAPPFLSAQPCVVVPALIPAAIGAGALRLRRVSRAHRLG
jgi:hypothetical protein